MKRQDLTEWSTLATGTTETKVLMAEAQISNQARTVTLGKRALWESTWPRKNLNHQQQQSLHR
jgi:hypothetical protein